MVAKFKVINILLVIISSFLDFVGGEIPNQYKPKSEIIVYEDAGVFMYYNIYDIFITEFGDFFLRSAYSAKKRLRGFLIVDYCIYSKTVSIKSHGCLKHYFNFARLQKCYNEYPYHLFYKTSDFSESSIYIPMYGHIKSKWNVLVQDKMIDDNYENFKIFVHREILSGIKELLGEEHEYYKYLLKKYAPLKPYENWKLYGNDYLKQNK